MLSIGSDHAGYELKIKIEDYLNSKNIEFKDVGTFNEESCDYPIFAEKASRLVSEGYCEKGILVCGSGVGMCIASNKIKNIRAVLCFDSEIAALSRKHNDANVLCLGGRFIDFESAKKIVDIFLNTPFEGGRHKKRIELIKNLENEFGGN
ncbi:MAG: ribose 5-phosphate isomerase B [Acutalibacteraceae bacterium]